MFLVNLKNMTKVMKFDLLFLFFILVNSNFIISVGLFYVFLMVKFQIFPKMEMLLVRDGWCFRLIYFGVLSLKVIGVLFDVIEVLNGHRLV